MDHVLLLLPVLLAVAAFVHGVYDFVVSGLPRTGLPVSASLIVGFWIWRMFLTRDLHKRLRPCDG